MGRKAPISFWGYTKTAPDAKPHEAVTCFIVDRGPGVETKYLYGRMGCRGSGAGRIVFTDVRVPRSHVVGTIDGACAWYRSHLSQKADADIRNGELDAAQADAADEKIDEQPWPVIK